MASEFFKLNATKEQKILLAILGSLIIGVLVFQFLLLPPYQNYRRVRAANAEMDDKLNHYYGQIVQMKRLQRQYQESAIFLAGTKSEMSMDGSQLLTMLTKNSPVEKFSYSSIEIKNPEVRADSIVQYPFEIGFEDDYRGIVQYLLYQESCLPISFINEIEIKNDKNDPSKLETKITGVIYKVN
ncbi:MAG: hypothetical protein ACOY90_04000 [Candidatus Zhuqueibacterota bacterium]